jgi:hypothetical protein
MVATGAVDPTGAEHKRFALSPGAYGPGVVLINVSNGRTPATLIDERPRLLGRQVKSRRGGERKLRQQARGTVHAADGNFTVRVE